MSASTIDRLNAALSGRYAIEREIGEGGMATVYLADDLKHDRSVALKVLRPELTAAMDAERFLTEIKTTAKLQHPNILPLFDSGGTEGFLFYVMPFVDGDSLRERLDLEKRIPVPEAVELTRTVAEALHSAHVQGVVHRDIKPANILLSGGRPLVADFGIARVASQAGSQRLTQTGGVMGTLLYISPEQASGEGDVDGRSDLYALACVLYEMIAGAPPFVASNPAALLTQHLLERAPSLEGVSGVSPGVAAAVARALEKDRQARFATTTDFAAALGGATGWSEVEGDPPVGGPSSSSRPEGERGLTGGLRRFIREFRHGKDASPAESGPDTGNELRPDSVAVLPFENLSTDPENAYFSDGITDDIIASIARIRGLRVLSRTSLMSYRGVSRPVGEIAGELGVATVVTGSVRRSGTRVRIVAEIVDARRDDHLWTETYDRELEDIFEIQSDVATQVSRAVQREISSADRSRIELRGTTNPEAYDVYLRGRFLWNRRTEAVVRESVEFYQRALERDSEFALAHAALADAYTVLGIYGAREPSEVYPAARTAAEKALSIDPGLGEAVAAVACVSALFDWDWVESEEAFGRALTLSPSYATAHQWYAVNALVPQGRTNEARVELERAGELDPGSSAISVSLGIVAFYAHDYATAAAEFESVARLHPRFALVHFFLGQCQALRGDAAAGLASLEKAVELSQESSETLAAYGHALARSDATSDAEGVLRRLEERAGRRYVSPALLAQVLIGLGRREAALERLEEAVTVRATDLIWVGTRPVYDPLRGDARFEDIVSEVGLG